MAFIKRLNENITTKRKTSTDIQPTGLLGDKLVSTQMLQDFCVTPQKLSFATSLDTNFGLSATLSANALTLNLLTSAGTTPSTLNPVRLTFRSNSLTLGNMDQVSVTSAVSLTVPAGATLGMANGVAQDISVYALNNAGTILLAVEGSDAASTNLLPVITAISGSSNSGTTLYSSSAFAGGLPAIFLGRINFTQATAGQWVSAPNYYNLGINTVRNFVTGNTSANSGVKTPTATGNYQLMTTNSITLVPGIWDLSGIALFTNGGTTAGYTATGVNFYEANGADSAVAPTSLGTSSNFTLLSTAIAGAGVTDGTISPCQVRVQVNSTASVFIVPFASMATPANARISANIRATRVR